MAISDCTRLWEGNREHFGTTSSGAEEPYRCAWSDRITSKTQFLGRVHSDHSWMICTDVDIEPLGDVDPNVGAPGNASLTVRYMDSPSAEDSGKAIEQTGKSDAFHSTDGWKERWTASGEAITIGEGFHWSDPSEIIKTKDDLSAVMLFPTATIMISGQTARVDSGAKNYMLNAVGKVNEKTITIRGYAYSDRHLLFLAPELEERRDNAGNRIDSISYNFAYRHNTDWNRFWDKKKQKFRKIISNSTSDTVFSDASFSDLNPSNW